MNDWEELTPNGTDLGWSELGRRPTAYQEHPLWAEFRRAEDKPEEMRRKVMEGMAIGVIDVEEAQLGPRMMVAAAKDLRRLTQAQALAIKVLCEPDDSASIAAFLDLAAEEFAAKNEPVTEQWCEENGWYAILESQVTFGSPRSIGWCVWANVMTQTMGVVMDAKREWILCAGVATPARLTRLCAALGIPWTTK